MINMSVIICTFNHFEYISQVLPSIQNQSYNSSLFEIIIVNDGSTDNTKFFLENVSTSSNLKIFHNTSNLGLAKSRNIGASTSNGSLLVFIDDDNLADHYLLDSYWDFYINNPNAFYQGFQVFPPRLLNSNFAKTWSKWVVPQNIKLDLKCIPAKNICPGNFAISKRNYFAVNGFNPSFRFWGLEDGEFAFRVQSNLSLPLIFVKKAITTHIEDSFYFDIYMKKYQSIGMNALPIIQYFSPSFLKTTNYKFILDINNKDTFIEIIIKVLLKLLFKSNIILLLLFICYKFDRNTFIFIPSFFYRLCLSYSIFKGYNSFKKGNKQLSWY